ncbi:class I SAM-dependent methyltransferase [Terrabacter aeriphilus]
MSQHRHTPSPGERDHHDHSHAHSHDGVDDTGPLEDLLDLDGEVLADAWDSALDRTVAALTADRGVAPTRLHVVDLGAGTGTGSLGLARRLPTAEVVAVDVSEPSLARLAAAAAARGVGDRVRPLVADLDSGWPALFDVDLTWASMSLHHLADPVRVLSGLREHTRSGGVVAVWEFDEPLRFLPDDLGVGRSGLEDRMLDVLAGEHATSVPLIGSPWPALLADAGWTVVGQHEVVVDEPSPTHPLAGRYARAWFDRLAHGLDGRLDADDAVALAALLDDTGPHALLARADLHLRGTRTLTIARR